MSSTIILELGDIIEIISPSNKTYHEKVFIIDYIDGKHIHIIEINSGEKLELVLRDNSFEDETIETINLLDRNEKQGFIAQNNLEVNNWVQIHFGGDYPGSFTARISNIENDMLELTTYPEINAIYIDFKYQGIPLDLPISKIELVEPPQQIQKDYNEEIKEQDELNDDEILDETYQISPQEQNEEAEVKIEDELQGLYNETNEIIFGEKLDTVKEVVELDIRERRYDIEAQLNDFMDQLLSTIPDAKSTPTVMNNIKLLLTRFKELRQNFSVFENDYIILKPKEQGPFHKPLITSLKDMNQKLKWLIPVVTQRKKIYIDDDSIRETEDIVIANTEDEVDQIENSNTYDDKQRNINNVFKPFMAPYESSDIIHIQEINTNIEAIVDNLLDFNSTTYQYSEFKNKRFFIEQYNLSTRKNIPNDKIYVKSFITLPKRMVEFSKLYLPESNMLERTNIYQQYYGYYRFLHKYTDVIENTLDSLETEIDYTSIDVLNDIHHFSLSSEINMEREIKYDKFLESFVPKTKSIINMVRNQLKLKMNMHTFVRELEPYMVYTKDITYSHFDTIRFSIKENIKAYKKDYLSKAAMFKSLFDNKRFQNKVKPEIVELIGDEENKDENVTKIYKLDNLNHDSEMLQTMTAVDSGKLFYSIMAKQQFHLRVPKKMNLLDAPKTSYKVKDTCERRYLAKHYETEQDMLKDTNKDELFYDSQFDDTPYEILESYETERKSMSHNNFVEFLVEVLLEKHDAQSSYATEMAQTLIRGKKVIDNGDYARVETTTTNAHNYYKYNKKNWVKDNSVTDETFLNDNELFCNIQNSCIKNKTNNVCENTTMVKDKLEANRVNLINEMNSRIEKDIDLIQNNIDDNIKEYSEYLQKYAILKEIQEQKYNNVAYQLGLYASAPASLKSPHFNLLQKILGNTDFSDKQQQIVRFVELFCREPIEGTEEKYWKYCQDTNVRLIPSFLHTLAESFVLHKDYSNTLMQLVRNQGVLSDDGEAIIDRYSGMTIRKIDYSDEEGFDPMGFAISSRDILEEDLMAMRQRQQQHIIKTFENPVLETIHSVFSYLCKMMDIKIEQIQDQVLNLSNELVQNQIISKDAYLKRASKLEKEKGKTLAPYDNYYDETLILIVSSVLLITIQTVIPSIITTKTFPGCVNSFSGYPLVGGEDLSGIEYLACVLYKTKSNIKPWNSVYKYNQATFTKRIKAIIDTNLIVRNDVNEKYKTKKIHLQLHNSNNNHNVHKVQKWLQFQPPLISLTMKEPVNFTKDFKQELLSTIKTGHIKQEEMRSIVLGKLYQFNYSLIDTINSVVKHQIPLLKTYGMIPFTDNACCNSNDSPMTYFKEKNDQIKFYLKNIEQNELFLRDIQKLVRPTTFFHNTHTRIVYPELPKGQLEENIYAAFINYCNFDRDIPVPKIYEHLCGEKPKDYDSSLSLEEKMMLFKRSGKKYDTNNLLDLMNVVNSQNEVTLQYASTNDFVDNMNVLFEELEIKNSTVIEEPLMRLMKRTMVKYEIHKKHTEDTKEIEDLKNYLLLSNNKMYLRIMDFIERNGALSNNNYNEINDYLMNVSQSWSENGENKHNIVQSFFNINIHNIVSVFGNIILNNPTHYYTPRGLKAHFSKNHLLDLYKILKSQFVDIAKYSENGFVKRLMQSLEEPYLDLLRFYNHIPFKNEINEYSFYDIQSQELLMTYIYYSLFYEMIESTESNEMQNINIELRKKEIVNNNNEDIDDINAISQRVDENNEEEHNQLHEVEVNTGNIEEANKLVGELIYTILEMQRKHKNEINHSYSSIIKKTKRAKDYEKKQIIKYLGDMTKEERKVEDLHKKYKMGRWNVVDVVNYRPDVYDMERNDMIQQLVSDRVEGGDVVQDMVQNVVDLENYESEQQNDMYEDEANNIAHLGENYQDGNFYEEDQEYFD